MLDDNILRHCLVRPYGRKLHIVSRLYYSPGEVRATTMCCQWTQRVVLIGNLAIKFYKPCKLCAKKAKAGGWN